jgi:large subunit ribosomal protein L4e
MARGHRVDAVPELPLVLDNLHASTETKTLLAALKTFGAGDDLEKVLRSKKVRTGVGKYRNSRYVMRKGPLIVYGDESKAVK